jgi:hypothetical protein
VARAEGAPMSGSMNWQSTMKVAALTALAERAATAAPIALDALDARWTWDPHEVWLSRVRPARNPAACPVHDVDLGTTEASRRRSLGRRPVEV